MVSKICRGYLEGVLRAMESAPLPWGGNSSSGLVTVTWSRPELTQTQIKRGFYVDVNVKTMIPRLGVPSLRVILADIRVWTPVSWDSMKPARAVVVRFKGTMQPNSHPCSSSHPDLRVAQSNGLICRTHGSRRACGRSLRRKIITYFTHVKYLVAQSNVNTA